MTVAMLTTKDNPFNPIEQFDEWFQYDESKGYHSCNVLASHLMDSNGQMPIEDDANDVNETIDEIILEFPEIEFIKVTKEI